METNNMHTHHTHNTHTQKFKFHFENEVKKATPDVVTKFNVQRCVLTKAGQEE